MSTKFKNFPIPESIDAHIEFMFEEPDRRLLNKGVVVDVIFDPSNLASEEILRLRKLASLTPLSLFESCPRNAIIARLIDDGKDHFQIGAARLCYPLFPPHLCLPVKAGEQVFILDPTPDVDNDIMYWIGRVPEPDYVDDINFTHGDRRVMESPLPMDPESLPEVPEFIDGMGTDSTTTLREEDAYEMIFTGSLANKSATFEPVPRFTARPGDLALQGSNNTLICLGTIRGWTSDKRPPGLHSNASVELDDKGEPKPDSKIPLDSGAIDIVAGRGPKDKPTAPTIIENSRGFEEVNKNAVNYGKTGAGDNLTWNASEGDPDFVEDLSRVYVSMKMDGDKAFGLTYPKYAGDQVPEKPYVTVKSHEIRIVGRKEGSVRIVKEGAVGGDQCVITMLPGGTVAIDAKKIIIGDGRADQVYLGEGATEPLMQGAKLEAALHALADAIEQDTDGLGTPFKLHPVIGPAIIKFKLDVTAALSPTSFTK